MSPTWSTACPDWEQRIVERRSLIPFPPLFPDEAEAALAILRDLKIVDAIGSPTIGEACRDWFFEWAAAIFGAYDAETGRRLINEFFLLISKKNSKSTGAAGIMLTALLRNWRRSAEFIILAPTIEVAKNSAEPAMDMVNEDPQLSKLLRPVAHQRTILHRTTGASLKIVAADSEVVSGKKASGVLIEELWLFGKMANAKNMLREAIGGLASRPEGFVIALSTQSDEPPAGVFKEWLTRFRKIRDGEIVAPRSLGVLYEFPQRMLDDGSYTRPENFYVTNPNLGASVDIEFLIDEQTKAIEAGKDSLPGFYAKHLNVEVGLALRSDRWKGADFWQRRADRTLNLDALLESSEVVVIGIDGGGLDDLLGLAVLGREKGTRRWLLWNQTWVHESVLELRKSEAQRLRDFESVGELTIVKAMPEAFAGLAALAKRINESGLLHQVGMDPVGVGMIVDALAEVGIANVEGRQQKVVGVSQGWKLNGAIKTAEVKLASGEMVHAGQAIMDWAVGNAKVEPKGNAITITKQAAGTGKIDPLMAAFDAVALMSMNPPAARRSYLERGELMVL